MHAIEKGIQGAYALDMETLTAADAVDSLIKIYILEVESIDSSLETASSMDSTLLLAQLEAAMDSLQCRMEEGASLWSSIKETREEQLQQLSSGNSAIEGSLLPAQNERVANSLFLSVFHQLTPEPTAAQLDSLESIAGQCPLDGGNAVFFARGLLAMVKDTSFLDASLCEEAEERPGRGGLYYSLPEEALWLYPNPADESLVVEYAGKPLPGAVLRIASATGQIFILRPLEKLKENRLDISALKPGMYYIHLVGPNGILALEKLVVIR